MDTIKIDTSQNVVIEQPIASIGERIAASLLDVLFISGYMIILIFIFGEIHSTPFLIIATIPVFLYNLICELVMNGQSWGKKILKIKIEKIDGTAATFSSYFIRWITGFVEIYAFFGSLALIAIIINQKGQRLGDIAANTSVIRLRNKSIKESVYTYIPENYTVVYPETSNLSINDIYTIKELLELLKSNQRTAQTIALAQKAREVIEKKLGIDGNQNTIVFFQTILRDYNFINSRI